jgi:hypothetical protein
LIIIPIIIFLRCRLLIHKRFIASAFKYARAAVLMTRNVLLLSLVLPYHGVRGCPVDVGNALQAASSRGRFPTWSLGFFLYVILLAALRRWGRLSF